MTKLTVIPSRFLSLHQECIFYSGALKCTVKSSDELRREVEMRSSSLDYSFGSREQGEVTSCQMDVGDGGEVAIIIHSRSRQEKSGRKWL